MVIKPSHVPLYLLLKCPSEKRWQACSAFRRFSVSPFCPPLARATYLWSLFCACWSGFCACYWSQGFDTEALLSAKDSILQRRGSLSCLPGCWGFILGKFLSFPGDEAWATFAPAWVTPEGVSPVLLCRLPRVGVGHVNSRALPHFPAQHGCRALLLCHVFIKRGSWGVVKVRPCLKKPDRN